MGDNRVNDIEIACDLQLLRNFVGMMPKTYRKRNSNMTIVGDLLLNGTDHSGSTSCHSKCYELGIRPHGYELPTFKEICERNKLAKEIKEMLANA